MRSPDDRVIETDSGHYGPDHVFHEHNGYFSGWE